MAKIADTDEFDRDLLVVVNVLVDAASIQEDRQSIRIYLGFDDEWTFSLPMTKLKLIDNLDRRASHENECEFAALRVAGKWMRQTIVKTPKVARLLDATVKFSKSATWKVPSRYSFWVYETLLDSPSSQLAGRPGEWLTAKEILQKDRHPISPTTRWIIGQFYKK